MIISRSSIWRSVESMQSCGVALDKDEGFVKAQITRAVRLHRLSFQRG